MFAICKMIVDESSHQLYEIIANHVDHKTGCQQLDLCATQ